MNDNLKTSQLAKALGISPQRVNELRRRGKIEPESDGGWNLPKVLRQLNQNLDARQSRPSIGKMKSQNPQDGTVEDSELGNKTLLEAQRRLEWAKAEKAEDELKIRRYQLLDTIELQEGLGERLIAMRNRAEALPANLSQQLALESDPITVQEILKAEMDALLREFSSWQPNVA